MHTLPHAMARFVVLMVAVIWLGVAFGGTARLGAHIAGVFGLASAVPGWLRVRLVGPGALRAAPDCLRPRGGARRAHYLDWRCGYRNSMRQ